MDKDERRRQLDGEQVSGLNLEAADRPELALLVRLIVGQTVAVGFLLFLTVFGGLLTAQFALISLTPVGVVAFVVGLISYWLLQRGRTRLSSHVFLVGTSLAITLNVFLRGYQDASALYYLWPILAAMVLVGVREGLIILAFSTLSYLVLVVLQQLGYQAPPIPYDPQSQGFLTVGSRILMFFLVAFLAWVYQQDLSRALARARRAVTEWRELKESLEERVEERTRGLQAAAEVSRATTSVLDPDQLLQETVEVVQERFDLYYVGLFLADEEREFAVLRAGTGEAGRQMLQQKHMLAIGGESMIGACVARGEPRIALDVGAEAVRFDNPLLPQTRSEMALPLRSRDQVIGAMSVQSTREAAFGQDEIEVMQTMADQVAVAIDNARLFAETEFALRQLETVHQRYLGEAWSEYLRDRERMYYETPRPGASPLGEEVLREVRQVLGRRRATVVVDEEGHGRSAVIAPISLRGTLIGALGIHDEEGGRQWTDEEVALVEAVTERIALAAENLRLLEQTQSRAAREQLTARVAARMRESLDIDAVLRAAVREIGEALAMEHVEVRLYTGENGGDGGR